MAPIINWRIREAVMLGLLYVSLPRIFVLPSFFKMAKKSSRLPLFKILCIISMVCSGLLAVSAIAAIVGLLRFFGNSIEIAAPFAQNPTARTTVFFVSFLLLLFLLSFSGAVLMFRRRKAGFVVYAVSNGLLLVIQIISLLLVFNGYSLLAALLSALFIVLYASRLKQFD